MATNAFDSMPCGTRRPASESWGEQRASAADPTIVYALTDWSDGWYSALTALSAWSVRLYHPAAEIHLVCDERTAARIHSDSDIVRDYVDKVITVAVSEQSEVCQSRATKIQTPGTIAGPTWFIDGDTMLVAPLAGGDEGDIQVVHDRNHRTGERIVPSRAVEACRKLQWPNFDAYYNSGVVRLGSADVGQRLSELWNTHWRQYVARTNDHRDQIAFNHALRESEIQLSELPVAYNTLVINPRNFKPDSVLLHFYASMGGEQSTSVMATLARALRETGRVDADIYRTMIRHRLVWASGVRWEWSQRRYTRAAVAALRRLGKTVATRRSSV